MIYMQTECISLEAQTVQLDFAVVNQKIADIHQQHLHHHIVELDNIIIAENIFKALFYKFNVFSINPNAIINPVFIPYISFDPSYRTVDCEKFYLPETIFQNIEADLGIVRTTLTPCSNIALNKQLNSIKTVCDLIKTSSILCSLTWEDIVNTVRYKFNDLDPMPLNPDVILTLSVVFASPTCGVHPTTLKFNYKTTINIG